MGGIPRPYKAANYNIPRLTQNLIQRADAADIGGSMPDDPDMPMQSAASQPNYIQRGLRRNMDRIHGEAESVGVENDIAKAGYFGSIPSYFTAKPLRIGGGLKGAQDASISKFNILQGLKALYGRDTAGQIGHNFIKYNQPGEFTAGGPFVGNLLDSREKHLKRPRYLIHGEQSPDDADGFHWADANMIYVPGAAEFFSPDTVNHEFHHAMALSGDAPNPGIAKQKALLDRLHPGELGVRAHLQTQPEFLHALKSGDENALLTEFDLMERYNPADPKDGHAAHDEWLADLWQWSHDESAIRGGNRNEAFLRNLREKLLDGTPPAEDPTFQYGPRAGQPAVGHARRQRSLNQLINTPSSDDWQKAMFNGLFRGGSMNTGHPKYPNV